MCSEIILQNELTYFDDFMVQTVPNSWITIFLHTLLLWIGSSEYALKKNYNYIWMRCFYFDPSYKGFHFAKIIYL